MRMAGRYAQLHEAPQTPADAAATPRVGMPGAGCTPSLSGAPLKWGAGCTPRSLAQSPWDSGRGRLCLRALSYRRENAHAGRDLNFEAFGSLHPISSVVAATLFPQELRKAPLRSPRPPTFPHPISPPPPVPPLPHPPPPTPPCPSRSPPPLLPPEWQPQPSLSPLSPLALPRPPPPSLAQPLHLPQLPLRPLLPPLSLPRSPPPPLPLRLCRQSHRLRRPPARQSALRRARPPCLGLLSPPAPQRQVAESPTEQRLQREPTRHHRWCAFQLRPRHTVPFARHRLELPRQRLPPHRLRRRQGAVEQVAVRTA